MTCYDLKNLGSKPSKKSSAKTALVLFVEIVIMIILVWQIIASTPRAIDQMLGIVDGDKTEYGEVTHRYLTPQQEYEKY